MRSRDVFFLLGLGFHLALVRVFAFATPTEVNAILQNQIEIVHRAGISGGTDGHQ